MDIIHVGRLGKGSTEGQPSPDQVSDSVLDAMRAARGDSNDTEIQALRVALDLAMTRWPEVDLNVLAERADAAE